MNKYEKLVQIVTMALLMEEMKTKAGIATKALARLVMAGPASSLATAVNCYGLTADGDDNRIDIRPVDGMADEYIAFFYRGGPKPEWLAHAGL